MRRLLYGTTALVGATMIAAGPAAAQDGPQWSLSWSGYLNEVFGFGDVDDDSVTIAGRRFTGTGHFNDGEIHFNGQVTLDNGVDVGFRVQIEAFTSGDQIDENYVYATGSFGHLILGSENAAAYLMHPGAPSVGVPINSGWVTVFVDDNPNFAVGFRHPSVSTFVDWGNDDNRVTYFSPRVGGFQVGASYTPCVNGTGTGANFPAVCLDSGGPLGAPPEGSDQISLGVNFSRDFDGVSVTAGAGWSTIIDESALAFPSGSPEQFQGGLRLGYMGFGVGGSVAVQDDDNDTAQDGWSFDVGASYTTGPWSVGATYFRSRTRGVIVGDGTDQEADFLEGGVEYALGPGVRTSASLLYADWDADTGDETSGVIGALGLHVSF